MRFYFSLIISIFGFISLGKMQAGLLLPSLIPIFALAMNMNREIMRIALPNIVSNITVPLMGIVSTAIAGHWGADSAA